MLNTRSFLRTSGLLIGLTVCYKLLGFVEKLVLAAVFGTSAQADAYLAGSSVVLLVGFLIQDIAAPALVPVLMADRAAGRRTIRATLSLVALIALGLTALSWLGAPLLALLFGPGFDAPTLALTAEIIRIGILALPALCLAAVLAAWSHAEGRFVRPALADTILKICPVIGIVLTRSLAGLTVGLAAGAWLRLLLIASSPGAPVKPEWAPREQGLGRVLHLAWPLLLTALVSTHLLSVIETALASTLGVGAVAAYAYARRILDVPVILVPQVVARLIFPGLAALFQAGDLARLRDHLRQMVRLTLLALVPLSALGFVLADPIIRLLLERGAFDRDSAERTALVFRAVLPGLPAHALATLLVRWNYAAGDTRWPSVIRGASAALHIGLAAYARRWGLAGLGAATTLVQWLETLALLAAAAWVLVP
ncbi:MAG TPA: lipid II flippase MurJ, partial [Herpetosiphonaceae bacterium]